MTGKSRPSVAFRTRSVDLGRVLVGSIDNIAEVLARAEGEAYESVLAAADEPNAGRTHICPVEKKKISGSASA